MKEKTDRIERNRRTKKELIYRAALAVFGRYGFKKATLEDIAGELDMTKSSLYRYARDKRDLYEQAVSYGLLQWQQTAAGAMKGEKDPLAELRAYALTGIMYLDREIDLHNVLLKDPTVFPLTVKEDRFAHINLESMNILKGILRRGVQTKRFRAMDIDRTAAFLYSVYVMLVIRSYVKSDIDSAGEMMTTALETLLKGIVRR